MNHYPSRFFRPTFPRVAAPSLIRCRSSASFWSLRGDRGHFSCFLYFLPELKITKMTFMTRVHGGGSKSSPLCCFLDFTPTLMLHKFPNDSLFSRAIIHPLFSRSSRFLFPPFSCHAKVTSFRPVSFGFCCHSLPCPPPRTDDRIT